MVAAMNDRQLLEHILEAADRLSDSILHECNSRSTEWLDAPSVQRIAGDAGGIQEVVAFVRKQLNVSSEEGSA
jgi:hypothetical protein